MLSNPNISMLSNPNISMLSNPNISMLPNPNLESPANVDMGLLWRDNFNEYKKLIYKII